MAGAREKFEDMATQLIHVERPDSQRVRIVTGDGGLDAFEGGLTDPGGIDVYQIKFFPEKIGDAQKQQIRESFATARDSKKFRVRSWTLCLPIDMSVNETEWFEGWVQKQVGTGINIDIRKPWGALHLEGLLLQEKNRAIRQAFFREENAELLRAQTGHLENILQELKQRGGRHLKLHISPTWSRNRLYSHIRLFNSGHGAIYVESWWTQWGPNGNQGGRDSIITVRGKLPIRLEEHDATDLLVEIETDVESLSGIGVLDGDRHLWLASEEDLVIFKHNAITHRLPGAESNQVDEASLEGIKVEVKARAIRRTGMSLERLEVTIKNDSDKSVPILGARLVWAYTPPRQVPTQPEKPSVAEAGGSVTLTAQAKANPLCPGDQVLFVLDEDMTVFLVELTRGDVRDEDISIEFATGGRMGWKASMDEIPSAVRTVANAVVERLRQSK
jgi:hypothetical protein